MAPQLDKAWVIIWGRGRGPPPGHARKMRAAAGSGTCRGVGMSPQGKEAKVIAWGRGRGPLLDLRARGARL